MRWVLTSIDSQNHLATTGCFRYLTIDKKKIYMNTENRTLFQMTRFCVLVFVIGACCLGCEREYDSIILDAWIFEDSVKVFITAERPALVIVEYRSEAGGCRGHYDTQGSWMGANTYHIHARQSDIHPHRSNTAQIISLFPLEGLLHKGRFRLIIEIAPG